MTVRPWVALVGVVAFAVGVGVGVLTAPLGSTAGDQPPATSSPSPADAPTVPTAAPEAAVVGDRPDGCEPASLPVRAGAVLVVGLPEVTDLDRDEGGAVPEAVTAAEAARVGGVFLTGANVVDRSQVVGLIRDLRARLGRELLVATDEETGRVSSLRAVVGPTSSPRTVAARGDLEQWRRDASALAEELTDLGIDWNLAPVADLDDGPPGRIIGDRSFSGDARVATRYALAFAEAHAGAGVVPTLKHFPGHGGTAADPHHGPVTDTTPLSQLHAADLRPFTRAIARDARVIMLSNATHTALDPDRPASLAPDAYALLRDLGFEGVAITDSVGMGAVHQRFDYDESAPAALAAGADAVLATDGRAAPDMAAGIVDAVERGDLAESRLDEAATRVLALAGRDPEPITCRAAPADFPDGVEPALPSNIR